MISILPTSERPRERQYPVGDDAIREPKRDDRYSIRALSPSGGDSTFDLFAQARQIYARARATQRVRSSGII